MSMMRMSYSGCDNNSTVGLTEAEIVEAEGTRLSSLQRQQLESNKAYSLSKQ